MWPVWLALVAILVLAAALRLRDVESRALWVDELFSVGLAVQDIPTTLAVLNGEEANMAIYYAVMHAWLGVTGPSASELWIRLPSVVFGVLGVFLAFLLGSELQSRLTGLVAALLTAVNDYHVGISQEARSYSLWALFVAVAWLALFRAMRTTRWRWWLAYALATALAFYSHFFTLFMLLPQAVVVIVRGRRAEIARGVASGLVAVALCSPFIPFFVAHRDGSQIAHVRPSDFYDLLDVLRLFAGGSTLLLVAQLGLALLGIAALAGPAKADRSRSRALIALAPLLWLVVPIASVFLLSYVKPMFKERYLFAAMPALPLAAAMAVTSLRGSRWQVGALVLALGAGIAATLTDVTVRQSENWRAAAAYLSETSQPDDGWIFISKRGQLGYDYYTGRLAKGAKAPKLDVLEPFDWAELASGSFRSTFTTYRGLESGTSGLAELSARHPRIWLVLSHEFDAAVDGDTSAAVRDWLTRRGYAARQRSFQGVRTLLYERRP